MMRLLLSVLLMSLLSLSAAHAKANCAHSHSWQCAHQAGTSGQTSQTSGGIATSGNTPDTGTTNTQLGSTTPTQPQVQITPVTGHQITGTGAIPKPKPMKVPPKQQIVAPPQNVYPIPQPVITGQGAIPQPQPVVVPPKQQVVAPPQNVYPIPQPVITGQGAIPQPQPVVVPPKQQVVAPPQNVYPIPQPVITGQGAIPTQLPQPGAQPLQPAVIITHVPNNNLHPNILLRQQTLHSGNKFEEIEPTLKNIHVDVYRGKDASKMLYKDTLPMDKKGFHLTMLGIKEPTFVDSDELLGAAPLRDFTFYFDFASVEINPDQIPLFGEIIDEYRKTGKRIIIVGETDNFGSNEYNRRLAVHRSTKIIDELKSRGVKDDEFELRVLIRCCRTDHPTKATLAETRGQRITWVHFE